MQIRGNLAEYNFAPCTNTYLLLDTTSKEKRIYSKNNIAYLAMVSPSLLPVPAGQQKEIKHKCATIVFQINLKTVKVRGQTPSRLGKLPPAPEAYNTAVNSRIMYIFRRIAELVKADDPEFKYLIFGDPNVDDPALISSQNNVRFRSPRTLTVDSLVTLFDGSVTLTEEYYGEPSNLLTEWTSLNGSVYDVLAGCSIIEAVQAKTNIDPSTIRTVLESIKDIIVETTVQAVQFGAYNMDYLVPPFGAFEIRPDFDPSHYPLRLGFTPDYKVEEEMSSLLGFERSSNRHNTATVRTVAARYRRESESRYGQRRS